MSNTAPLRAVGIIMCMRPTNQRRHYTVTSSLIGWAHKQNDPRSWPPWWSPITMTSHGRHEVLNHRLFHCLFNSLCRLASKKHQSPHHWPFTFQFHLTNLNNTTIIALRLRIHKKCGQNYEKKHNGNHNKIFRHTWWVSLYAGLRR